MGLFSRVPILGLGVLSAIAPMCSLALAGSPATSGWMVEAKPADATATGNPALCKSFEKGVIERIAVMRTLRFGGQKPPPLLPSTVNDWQKQTQIDPDSAKRYASEEAMVKRLNAYMVDNGCTPVDVEAELRKGPVSKGAERP